MCVYVIRKWTFFCFAAAAVLTVIFSAANLIAHVTAAGETNVRTANTIVIDAGHGGIDPGAIGVGGVQEKDINLSIALKLRDLFLTGGYDVVMIRDTDISIHDEKYTSVKQIKTSDLKNRLKKIEEYPDALVIMVHQNYFEQSQYHGAQMFYGKKNAESEILARYLQDSIRTLLQPENTREVKCSTGDVYILHKAKNPIVLAECGFLSNAEECALLNSEEYQMKMALAIYGGAMDYRASAEK